MSTSELLEKKYLNEKEVSAITGRAISTIRNERFMRKGLPYLKVGGRSIRYKAEDVVAYMEGRRITFDKVAA
jgi:predicted DNA-binding transcriptional regulator AlpA